jgi:asparagine synthase (glutamine-hydrolysing)
MGFAVPLAAWFRGPLANRMSELVAGPRLAATGWFDTRFLAQLVEAHRSGRRDHSAILWSLFMFERFLARAGG